MKNFSEKKTVLALQLLSLMQDMAQRNTNAVLEITGNTENIKRECRYPEVPVSFGNEHWRAFYHCHSEKDAFPGEHGHFHLFTDIGEKQWAHVAGLGVDAEGQLLRWFAVNRWVTDGPWLDSEQFMQQLDFARPDENESLVANWLSLQIQLYAETIHSLLLARDKTIDEYVNGRDKEDVLNDREIYTLAQEAIDLQSLLEKHLVSTDKAGMNGEPVCA